MNATCVLSRSYGVQEPCPTNSTLVSDHIEGCQGKMVLTGSTVQRNTLSYTGSPPRESSRLVKKVFSCHPNLVVRDLPCSPHTLSPCLPSIQRYSQGSWLGFAGASLRHGSEQSEMTRTGTNLWPWPLRHLQTQLTELSENPPFTEIHMQHWNTERLWAAAKRTFRPEGFPRVTCPLTLRIY